MNIIFYVKTKKKKPNSILLRIGYSVPFLRNFSDVFHHHHHHQKTVEKSKNYLRKGSVVQHLRSKDSAG